jgi:hypothetical protein
MRTQLLNGCFLFILSSWAGFVSTGFAQPTPQRSISLNGKNYVVQTGPIGSVVLASPLNVGVRSASTLAADCATFESRMRNVRLQHCTLASDLDANSSICRAARSRIDYARYEAPDESMTASDTVQIWRTQSGRVSTAATALEQGELSSDLGVPAPLLHTDFELNMSLASGSSPQLRVVALEDSWTKRVLNVKGVALRAVQVRAISIDTIEIVSEGREIACDLLAGKLYFESRSDLQSTGLPVSRDVRNYVDALWSFRNAAQRLRSMESVPSFGLGIRTGHLLAQATSELGLEATLPYLQSLISEIVGYLFDGTGELLPYSNRAAFERGLLEPVFRSQTLHFGRGPQ